MKMDIQVWHHERGISGKEHCLVKRPCTEKNWEGKKAGGGDACISSGFNCLNARTWLMHHSTLCDEFSVSQTPRLWLRLLLCTFHPHVIHTLFDASPSFSLSLSTPQIIISYVLFTTLIHAMPMKGVWLVPDVFRGYGEFILRMHVSQDI